MKKLIILPAIWCLLFTLCKAQEHSLYKYGLRALHPSCISLEEAYQWNLDVGTTFNFSHSNLTLSYSPIKNIGVFSNVRSLENQVYFGGGIGLYQSHVAYYESKGKYYGPHYEVYLGVEKGIYSSEDIKISNLKYYLESAFYFQDKYMEYGIAMKLNYTNITNVLFRNSEDNEISKKFVEFRDFEPIIYPEISLIGRYRLPGGGLTFQMTQLFAARKPLLYPNLSFRIGGFFNFYSSKIKDVNAE